MNHNSDIWEEWMGYCVYYMNWNNEGPFIDPSTDYGIPLVSALSTMNAIYDFESSVRSLSMIPTQLL